MFPDPQNKTSWWQPSLLIFGRISIWIAGPLIIALFLGKWLDKHFNTKPWIFLGVTGIAFIISLTAIVRIIRAYIAKMERENKNKKNTNGTDTTSTN